MNKQLFLIPAFCLITLITSFAQTAMTNIYGRNKTSLNGKWEAIIDQISEGIERKVYLNRKPEKDSEFGDEALYGQDGDVNKAWYVMYDYYNRINN